MIKPLVLGSRIFPNNLIQGPLAGVSCAPFRALTWRYSQPAFSCTEMISCKTLLHSSKELQKRFITKDPAEGPLCFQLSASNPQELGQATRIVTNYGADLIDLNCGCPVKKIRSRGAGSSLLMDAPKLYQLIRAMKDNTNLPVSIKIRIEGHSADKFNQEIAQVVSDAGADFLVVHGRHWTEHYETPCNHDQIKFFVENLKIPVIGNGDVADLESLHSMFATSCAGVMIGRAGVGQPWLIQQLIREMQADPFNIPSLSERASLFIEHAQALAELLGSEKFAVLQARKLAKYYARGLEQRTAFCEAVNQCEDLRQLELVVLKFF